MITTTPQPRATRKHLSDLPRIISALALLLMLASCTNSKLLVTPFYNKLDDKILAEFNKLADFNKAQSAVFEQAVGTFHVWHRQSELPQYAQLLQDIARTITEPEATTDKAVTQWVNTAETLSRSVRECYPINFMAGTAKTLTDKQINSIESYIQNEQREDRQRHESLSAEERMDRRVKNADKWADRIDLKLTQQQRDALRDSFSRQISLRKQYLDLLETWNQQLFAIARNQQDKNYEAKIQAHIAKRWTLLETNHADESRSNRQLFRETVQEFVHSLDAQQRRSVSRWVGKMGSTLQAVSQDKPSFRPGKDASVGCLVQTAN
ncbi:DUF6279 family lipoprotein [Granulosicoccus antarcticus]|uniref:Lipoprotein n=1 Tax=Granulosicoccus antarcticus IMCC3135 TaxID=1192854 RepID=A0A2Z2NVX8_9GAMM|nr:DUF6279 family lipoprotein [Granulosicoccus antarcticus]ASJ75393.1 hypothetical protein IMCC3135_26690 [Granulosicoccus antarcticus IMCC3135]